MEKHYVEFACDYCKLYPCDRFNNPILGKVVMNNCKLYIPDENLLIEEEKKLELWQNNLKISE